jgi:hypothetical protein
MERIETSEVYDLNEKAKGKIRIRPDRNKKEQGLTWAVLSDFEYLPEITCPKGIFLDLCNWRGKKLMLTINTQNTKNDNIHENLFFEFNEFEKALTVMEEKFTTIKWK